MKVLTAGELLRTLEAIREKSPGKFDAMPIRLSLLKEGEIDRTADLAEAMADVAAEGTASVVQHHFAGGRRRNQFIVIEGEDDGALSNIGEPSVHGPE